jgi:GTP-binding protein
LDFEGQVAEFHRLGRGQLVCVSAQQNRGKEELLDLLGDRLPAATGDEPEPAVQLKVAIVGRRNTGKSTFINSLAKSERMIVSEVPGTTRDSVDVRFQRDDKVFIAIDTAGVRRRKSLAGDIEFYSLHRAERSIRRADVVLLFFDPRARVSKVDKQLAEYILDQHKPAVFVVNKWDLAASKMPTERYVNYLRATFPGLDYVPIAFITAKQGKNVYRVLNLAQNLHKQASARVSTGDLNRLVQQAVERQSPPSRHNRQPRIYYATQVAAAPPTIVLFTNGPDLFDETYLRYLLRTFRDTLPFHEVPIKLHVRTRGRDDRPPSQSEPEPEASPRKKDKKQGVDVADLEFRSNVTEDEVKREGKRYESELWKDL